jgi:hypothetical protein
MNDYPVQNANTKGLGYFHERGGYQRQSGMNGRSYKPQKLSAAQKEDSMAPTKKELKLDYHVVTASQPMADTRALEEPLESTQVTDG